MSVNHQVDQVPPAALRFTAFCVPCKREVATDGTHRCPQCGEQTDIRGRDRGRIVGVAAAEPARVRPRLVSASPPTEEPMSQGDEPAVPDPILLPAGAEAAAWYDATAALYDQYEAEEAVLTERLRQIRRARKLFGQVLGLVSVDEPTAAEIETIEEAPALIGSEWRPLGNVAEPTAIMPPEAPPKATRADAPAVMAGNPPQLGAAPAAASQGQPIERINGWPARLGRGLVYHCKDCGTTERPYFNRGRCEPCHRSRLPSPSDGGCDDHT